MPSIYEKMPLETTSSSGFPQRGSADPSTSKMQHLHLRLPTSTDDDLLPHSPVVTTVRTRRNTMDSPTTPSNPFDGKFHPKTVRKTSFLVKSPDAVIDSLLPSEDIRRRSTELSSGTTTIRRHFSVGQRIDLLDEMHRRQSSFYLSQRSASSTGTLNEMDRPISQRQAHEVQESPIQSRKKAILSPNGTLSSSGTWNEIDKPISQRQRLKGQESPKPSSHKSIPSPLSSSQENTRTSVRSVTTVSSTDDIHALASMKPVPLMTKEKLVIDLKIHLLNTIKEQSDHDNTMNTNRDDTERNGTSTTGDSPLSHRSSDHHTNTWGISNRWSKLVTSMTNFLNKLDGSY